MADARKPRRRRTAEEARHEILAAAQRRLAEGGPELADELEASGYAAFAADDTPPPHEKAAVRPGSLDELFSSR